MSHHAKISGQQKIAAIEKYLRGEDSLYHLAYTLEITFSSIKQWLQTYQSLGPSGLLNTSKNRVYSAELKKSAMEDYLDGGASHIDMQAIWHQINPPTAELDPEV